MCRAQCHAIHSACVVRLCWCRKQVAGQIPAHLASQMKPQQWTEAVGQSFQEVEELSAVEAKKKYIGNLPLAQTGQCPSCCLHALTKLSATLSVLQMLSAPSHSMGHGSSLPRWGEWMHAQPAHITRARTPSAALLVLPLQSVAHPIIPSKAIVAVNKNSVLFLDVKTKVAGMDRVEHTDNGYSSSDISRCRAHPRLYCFMVNLSNRPPSLRWCCCPSATVR